MAKTFKVHKGEELNLELYKGDTNIFSIDVTEDGVAYDFTGYTCLMQVKSSKESETSVIEATSDPPSGEEAEIVLSSGTISIILPAADCNVTAKNYYYDIQLTHTETLDGKSVSVVETWLYGKVIMLQDVTRVVEA